MEQTERKLNPYLSPYGAWSYALGTSIGWGSLVITASTYLSKAGPMGSILGLVAGAVIMLVISRNYSYMIMSYPDAGGVYAYSKEVFGYDHGFLTAWFLALTYMAMLWANATSLPLFAKYFIGTIFQVGRLYTIFGYDVYLGEALLSIAAILLIGRLCTENKKLTGYLMMAFVTIFAAAITICFIVALIRRDRPVAPAFVPDVNGLVQVVRIAVISPWAFIGFENISHATEEMDFSRRKVFGILTSAVISATLLYSFITFLSVTAYPERYGSWIEYISDLGNCSGLEGLPAFYAASHYMGQAGVFILMIALLCLVLSSLVGNILAVSRLFYAVAKDDILPKRFSELNEQDIPARAIRLLLIISCVIPFLGRTAVGWIVDVTTIGAVLIYGYVSACTLTAAKQRGDTAEKYTGLIGLLIMLAFGAYILIPNLFTSGQMEAESYFLFVVWGILGFLFFHQILRKDQTRRFGNSIIVWIALLSLILFVSLVWMSQTTMSTTAGALQKVQEYYESHGISINETGFIAEELAEIRGANARSIVIVIAMFGVSLGVLLNNYSIITRRVEESEKELGTVREMANKDPMTGVKSKHAYVTMEEALNEQIAAGSNEDFGVLVCDVNGLKFVNDTYGHKAGDAYICAASNMICEIFVHSPVYRIGGDEFVVILEGRDFEHREKLLEELNRTSEQHIKTNEVVVSAGLSVFRKGQDRTMHDTFERADALMYTRKKQLKEMGAATRL